MLEKAVQAAIYEKALKNHYIEILYIDFENTGKCIKLHQDTKLLSGENIFPESDEQVFDDYICKKIMRYASGEVQDLKRVKKQMTMEAIVQGTEEHIIYHVMINFMLNGEMRFMQFDFTREREDTKNVFLFVEDYTDPQQQAFITTLRSIKNSAVLFCILSEEVDAKTTLCYDPVFITQGFAEVMETTQEQMMLLQKKPFCETVHPDDLQYVEKSVRSLNIEHPHTNIFYRKRNPQGKWFYMQSDFSYLIVGKKKYIYVTYQDVSALQKNEELSDALHYSQKRDEELTKALEALGTVFTNIFLVHVEDQKVEWLKIQADKENVLKQCKNVREIRKLIHDNYMLPECQKSYLEFTDLDTISERFEKHKILRYIYRNMNRQWIEVSAIVQNRDENGRVTDIQFLTHDVTDQRERELQQEDALRVALASAEHANKAKTAFLNNMSHDIRTPMNAIIGFAALAAAHMDQPDLVKDYLTKIGTSSQHLLSLINDVLDMSRIESGSVKIEENEVCIPDILHDLKTIIQGNIQAKQQDLYIDTQDVVHENVITDRLRLNQILLNIVSNAIKFTPVGGTVNIRVSEKPCNRKAFTAFEFRISDNGIGMSEEFQAHVFDSFSRERSSTQSGIKGTGLGMAITRNIVDMMGGTISLTSKEGKGTEFVVTLNFKTLEKSTVYGPIPELIGARALVVDDDVHTCTSVSKMLREIEMRADWSTSGREAVIRAKEAFEQNDAFKAYLIDWLMPDMNGIETVRRIRAVIGEETPIIILTAYDWSDIEQEAKEAGVTAFVEKPIFMSELRKVLTKPMNIKAETSQQTERENRYSGKKVVVVKRFCNACG
ncbi:ATP-binding protein [Brotaphodocola catenula]|uniref:Circadian input-output histidine kinase CikA n=1 Tax=Brotaphodocola catenula TaxID=2885361 RepID=A0AAE3AUZ4_9FIRM|nr:ATP-binding protein [Brotaphodocola catenula]MCC2165837.1 response regulator [Brotaphodocola catenula]